jgi:uncharacterized protein YcbK (DUF882 family)
MNYFKPEDFKCKCGQCDGGSMDAVFLEDLFKARELAQTPYVITSAYRCKEHNRKVGGKENSAHLRGRAVDIKLPTSQSAFKVIKSLMDVGFVRIGYNSKYHFVHVDNDPTLPQGVFFDY